MTREMEFEANAAQWLRRENAELRKRIRLARKRMQDNNERDRWFDVLDLLDLRRPLRKARR